MKSRIVASRFQAHEVALLFISVVLGVNYLLVTIPPPESLQALVPKWVVILWALGLVVSGLVGLIAIFWQRVEDTYTVLQVELGALVISSGTLLLILGSIIAVSGLRGAFGIAFILAWFLANILRALQIRKDLKQLETIVKSGGVDER